MPKINDEYDIGKAFAAIEDELIASMIRNMERHKVEEVKEDKQWSMWQAEQLKSLEAYRKNNQKKFKQQFSDINAKIEELIRTARDEGEMDQEISILNAIKRGFPAERISQETAAEFFKVNDRKLNSLIDATVKDVEKAETAVLRMANDQYRKIIYNAQVYANTGAGTYEKAVDMATKNFLSAGINCIQYSNGARHTIADYADMAIRTASKRAYLQGEGQKRQEWGIHTVIVNKRGNPCPKCLPFVGKVLIDDVWSGGSRKDGKYPLMSTAIDAGLYHPRCKDSHTTYFPGISTADDTWTKEELEQIGLEYQEEQREQYASRQADKYERLAKYSLDEENQEKYRQKQEEWKNQHPPGWRRQFMRQQDQATDEFLEEEAVFRMAKTKAEAEAFGKLYSESGDFSIDGEFKLEIINGFNEAAYNVQKRFGKKLKIKGIKRMPSGNLRYMQGSYNPYTQMVSLKNSNMKTLAETAEKFFRDRWNASADKYQTFYHEIGHAVWEDLPAKAQSEIQKIYQETNHSAYLKWMDQGGFSSGISQVKIFGKELSEYANKDEKEFFSEAFSQIMSGRMRPVSRRVNEVLTEYYKIPIENRMSSAIIKLPRYQEAVIPKAKFVEYALNPEKDLDKAKAFQLALGYTKENADELIQQIYSSLSKYSAKEKPDNGWGKRYEVKMDLTGPNGKTAKVITAWIDDKDTGKMRLTSAYVDKG